MLYELNVYIENKVCVPANQIANIQQCVKTTLRPVTLQAAVSEFKQSIEGEERWKYKGNTYGASSRVKRCHFHDQHWRVRTGRFRPILSGGCEVLRDIEQSTRDIFSSPVPHPQVVTVEARLTGDEAQAVELNCIIRVNCHLSRFQLVAVTPRGPESLKERCLRLVGETLLYNQPRLCRPGLDPNLVRDTDKRRLGEFHDPGLGDLAIPELPSSLREELEVYVCSVRGECSVYQQPDRLFRPVPEWVVNYFVDFEVGFLANRLANIIDIE